MTGLIAQPAALHAATIHQDTITGVRENDETGGTGGYGPGYDITVGDDSTLHYNFADGDSVAVQAATGEDVFALSTAEGASPIALDAAGTLDLSAIRDEVGAWGIAAAINNRGGKVTVNGDANLYARADDEVSPEGSGSGAHGVISAAGGDGAAGSMVFNGSTDIRAYSPGYARAVWVSGRSSVTFNGPTTILAESRGTMEGVYNSEVSSITFNGDTSISALSIWPSDNGHAIYNDGVNSRLTVNGNLALTTITQGSTAFGVRNQGIMEVTGDTTVNVEGMRSSHGVANTHGQARMIWGGDVDIRVRGGSYVPFGNPSGINNARTHGAYMRFDGAVAVDVESAAETDGIISTGNIEFTSVTDSLSLTATSTCDGCDVYAIHNFGNLSVAGGLIANATATGDGAAWSVWNLSDTQDAQVSVNSADGNAVRLDGDILTATNPGNEFVGAMNINLDTASSYFRGLVRGWEPDTDFITGETTVAFSNGASWIPRGAGTMENDFGSGTLTLGSGGIVDLAGHWGSFEPGAVPEHSYRQLVIDSSTGNASVALEDRARFLLLSDITGLSGDATADRIVFGSGIGSFSADGSQSVGIVYDPVLDDTSWVNAASVRDGITIPATTPIVVVDASDAGGGNATFSAVGGLDSEWSGTFENALVQFTYTPEVALSNDGRRILLNGLSINGGSEDGAGNGGGDAIDPGGVPTGDGSGIRPSETVLAAADTADSIATLWRLTGQAPLQRMRSYGRDGEPHFGTWIRADGGELAADTPYSRGHSQDYRSVTVGGDRMTALGGASNFTGISAGRIESSADYARGTGDLSGTTVGLYTGWIAGNGSYLFLGAEVASLENRYVASDSQGRRIAGDYRTDAGKLYAEGGYRYRFQGSYYIEPQLGLHAGMIDSGEHTTDNGVAVSQDKLVTSFARAGIAFGKTLRGRGLDGNLYAQWSARHDFGDELEITASRDGGSIVPVTADRSSSGSELVVGGDIRFTNAGLFFEASRAEGVDSERDWGARVGMRFNW